MTAAQETTIDALTELARQVRQSTLQLLHVPDRSWLLWAPQGTSNHILWHAGHALWVQDALTVQPLTETSELPAAWAEVFGENSRPALVKHWPDEAEIRSRLENQLHRIVQLLVEHADRIVAQASVASVSGGWPLLAGMIHGWHDEARHQGEMYLLYKQSLVMSR